MSRNLHELFGIRDYNVTTMSDAEKGLLARRLLPEHIRNIIMEISKRVSVDNVYVNLEIPAEMALHIANDVEFAANLYPDGTPEIIPRKE